MKAIRALIVMAAVLASSVSFGGERWWLMSVAPTGATSVATAAQVFSGTFEEVLFETPKTTGTGTLANVMISVSPAFGTTGTVSTLIYTNSAFSSATSTRKLRPRLVPQAAVTGTNLLTSVGVWEPYLCAGDRVTLRVKQTNATTNPTYRVWMKFRD